MSCKYSYLPNTWQYLSPKMRQVLQHISWTNSDLFRTIKILSCSISKPKSLVSTSSHDDSLPHTTRIHAKNSLFAPTRHSAPVTEFSANAEIINSHLIFTFNSDSMPNPTLDLVALRNFILTAPNYWGPACATIYIQPIGNRLSFRL